MKASDICDRAAELVGGNRNEVHGDIHETHTNIAALWNAYLNSKVSDFLHAVLERGRNAADLDVYIHAHEGIVDATDVALMQELVKIARTKTGRHNLDDYIDQAGYAGVAAECAAIDRDIA